MRRIPWIPAVAGTMLATISCVPVAAQVSEITVEVGGSRISPPVGAEGPAAGFFVGGLRGSRFDVRGSGLSGAFLVGRALDGATGGNFLSAELSAAGWRPLSGAWAAGLEGRAFGFRVDDPFPYEAVAVEGAAVVRFRSRRASLRLAGTGGVGRSRVTITSAVERMRHRQPTSRILEDDLWRFGATAEALGGGGRVAAGVAAGIHRSPAGTYRSGGIRLILGGTRGALEVRGDVWRTPQGDESTGGVAFYLPWGGWRARGLVGRPEPDPLLLADPGSGAAGVLVGRRVFGRDRGGRRAGGVHRILESSSQGARVRFAVRAPGATQVEVVGDFSLWEAVAMASSDGRWTVEVQVPAGTHHFGFLVDGSWYLPDDAPDVVPDEWGRRSATLVIEGDAGS